MTLSTDTLSLLARAARAIDSLVEIDAIASIGGPMDELVTLHGDLTNLDAVSALVRTGVEMPRVMRALTGCEELGWRIAWLSRHTGVDSTTAELVAALSAPEVSRLTAQAVDFEFRAALTSALDLLSAELHAALAPHEPRTVPDTVPVEWERDVFGS